MACCALATRRYPRRCPSHVDTRSHPAAFSPNSLDFRQRKGLSFSSIRRLKQNTKSQHPSVKRSRGAAGPARGPAAPPACTACRLALPSLHVCSLRCLRVLPAASLRSPCTTRHDIMPTQRCVGAMAPRPPVTLRARRLRHADKRDPHFRPRRPCSHLRRARSDQDDQPAADEAGPSHAGAHGCLHKLSPRAACSTKNCALSP